MAKYTAIGGQALIEGIMMKSPEKTALGVRTPDGSIDITEWKEKSLRQKHRVLGIPVVRGVISFAESLIQGYRAMMLSAEKSGFTDLEEDAASKKETGSAPVQETEPAAQEEATAADEKGADAAAEPEKEAAPEQKKEGEKKSSVLVGVIMTIGSVLGVVLAVVLFMLIPRLVVSGLRMLFHVSFSPVVRSGIEQVIKLAVFVLYVWLVSFMKDIKRVFMYHGAEHKTIFCYEKGLPLTVENVRGQKRFHPRCGTSFMILMILVSVIISTVVQMIFPSVYDVPVVWVAVKILLIPLTCGVGFEILKLCGKYDNAATRMISAPGLWLQRITTKEPADDMIEVAIAALRACEPETPDVDRSVDETAGSEIPQTEETAHDNI